MFEELYWTWRRWTAKQFRKNRCQHPNGKTTRYISSETPCASFHCPDCGVSDAGPVMTFDTPEEWMNEGRSAA